MEFQFHIYLRYSHLEREREIGGEHARERIGESQKQQNSMKMEFVEIYDAKRPNIQRYAVLVLISVFVYTSNTELGETKRTINGI